MKMEVVEAIAAVRERVGGARSEGRRIGLVPTMGAMHEGHGRLMERAAAECGFVVVSIFVNPIQFDRPSDYQSYPRDVASDADYCAGKGVHLVFSPSVEEMYPRPQRSFVEVTALTDHLCGRFRPGHFRGVATVVSKLFGIVGPDCAYFGEKDAQQLAVVRRMVRDLNMPIEVIGVPTVREADGLAMSSRNVHLGPEERGLALSLYRALRHAQGLVASGERDAARVVKEAAKIIPSQAAVKLEYLEVVDAEEMQPIAKIDRPVRVAGAMWVGSTRLIDNLFCEVG